MRWFLASDILYHYSHRLSAVSFESCCWHLRPDPDLLCCQGGSTKQFHPSAFLPSLQISRTAWAFSTSEHLSIVQRRHEQLGLFCNPTVSQIFSWADKLYSTGYWLPAVSSTPSVVSSLDSLCWTAAYIVDHLYSFCLYRWISCIPLGEPDQAPWTGDSWCETCHRWSVRPGHS